MNISNLNVNSYSDSEIYKIFKLPSNYTISQLEHSVGNLTQIVSNSLGIQNKNETLIFINECKTRLYTKLKNNNSMPNPSQMDFNANLYHNLAQQTPAYTGVNTIHSNNPLKQQRVNRRVILIDSQYRQNILKVSNTAPDFNDREFNTDFTLDLSEPLIDVVSMTVSSVHIPTSWYAFDHHLGNTGFSTDLTFNCKNIEPGNYDLSGLTQAIIAKDDKFSFTIDSYTQKLDVSYTSDVSLTFYRKQGLVDCSKSCVGESFVNQNLGWNLGFRRIDASGELSQVHLKPNEKTDVPAYTYGPKYFLLELNDYNQTQINSGIISITDRSSSVTAINTGANKGSNQERLTKAQMYTQNALLTKNTDKPNTSHRVYGTTSKDVLSIIPLEGINKLRPEPLIDDVMDVNVPRIYSGPVKIEKMRIRLLDDKGNLVNLHDNDWSFTLIVEQLH
tara:strand:- start:7029 stop:8366 length:1338 start_codon:yes stop_codon:yes gene_type:complete